MGFSVIVSKHVKDNKNDCSCEPTHDQVQQEKRHGVSCSHCEAQRQDLLCSRGYLSPCLNHNVSSTQPSELRGCLLGGDSRNVTLFNWTAVHQDKHPIHQVGAQDGPSTRISMWINSETSELVKADEKFDVELGHVISHETLKAAQE